jgi:beta-N-acetylhexosaminidase
VIATDEEGGDVTRLDTLRGSSSPGAAALGWHDDPALTEQVYASIGVRLVEAGITVNLAPVADVNVEPQNPVIGVRSFGADPDVAARHVAAAVRGIQRTGVAACVKHFPGHGATHNDSHHEMAVLQRSRDELEQVELAPFRAAIAAGARSVMTGHLLVPAVDPDNLATVSHAITTTLLRDELGYTGAAVTDALEMKALADTLGMGRGFVHALVAGADAIETGALDYPYLVESIPAAVAAALADGTVTHSRLEEAAARTTALAGGADADLRFDSDAVADAGRRCVEVVGPLPAMHRPLVLQSRPPGGMASGELPWSLSDRIARRVAQTETIDVTDDFDFGNLRAQAEGRTLVVVVRDPLRHAWQRHLIALAAAHPAAVVVDVGWPADLGAAPSIVRTRGVAPGLLDAAADVLCASVPAGGSR